MGPILHSRFQNAFSHRVRSTQRLSSSTQSVGVPQIPILANHTAEQGEALRGGAAATISKRDLSRIMGMPHLLEHDDW